MFITGTIIGILGICANAIIYQQKSGKSLLVMKLISDVLWLLHYLLLGAYTGACIAFIGVLREITFIKIDRRSRSSIIFLIIFCICSLISSVLTWKSPISLLPAIASLISICGFYLAIPRLSRLLSFPISLCMGIYSFSSASVAGVINEALTVISATIALTRHKKEKNCSK